MELLVFVRSRAAPMRTPPAGLRLQPRYAGGCSLSARFVRECSGESGRRERGRGRYLADGGTSLGAQYSGQTTVATYAAMSASDTAPVNGRSTNGGIEKSSEARANSAAVR